MGRDGYGPRWTHFLAPLYGVGARLYHGAHDRRWLRRDTLSVPVLSVGNLVVGGTGKTPVVVALARTLLAAGRRPAVLTRGHGGNRGRGLLLAGTWETGEAAMARESGDEPLLMSRLLPSVPVVVDKRRERGARKLLAANRAVDIFLLDDGLQYRKLERAQDWVLLDAQRPLGNHRFLPAGSLREPPSALARADHVLFTTSDGATAISEHAEQMVKRYAPGAGTSRALMIFDGLAPVGDGTVPECLAEEDVFAVAGIARPERFLSLLEAEGARVRGSKLFPDHHVFTRAEVADLERRARSSGVALVTTAKDAVRLEGLTSAGARWLVVQVSVEVEQGWDALLRTKLPELFSG